MKSIQQKRSELGRHSGFHLLATEKPTLVCQILRNFPNISGCALENASA